VLDGVYRSGADGVPEFIEVAAPNKEALHALLHTVIARLMKLLTRRGVLVEDDDRMMSPLEFLQRLAALVPQPRLHLIRYHGVLAPNATLRAQVVPQAPAARGLAAGEAQPADAAGEIRGEAQPVQARAQHIGWARLLERVFDIDMRRCPSCGAGELKIIAAILQRAATGKILTHLRSDPRPPPRGQASEAVHAFTAG
jgi:hypothetical protein